MPELPEVEVTRLGVSPHLIQERISDVVLRRAGLRWDFPPQLAQKLIGQVVLSTARRSKYLLINFHHGTLIIHLGMSGHLRILPKGSPAKKHDHVDIVFNQQLLRMTDPRRFGAVLWHEAAEGELESNPLFAKLGMEPLTPEFNGKVLHRATRKRTLPIKQMLLSGNVVVGVGNIYASESLFMAGISPFTPVNDISLARYNKLAKAIQHILSAAIKQGGSTLRDFVGADGNSGYFQQTYAVYDRQGEACRDCGTTILQIKQGQRSTFYCPDCQT